MRILFTETLRKLRTDKGLSQRELAERMYVTRSTVARWKSGSRLPDAMMILRLSQCLDTDVNKLLSAAESDDAPNVIMVADRKIFLSGALPILEEVMPNAIITDFTRPSEAIEYAKANRIALAFLDIEESFAQTKAWYEKTFGGLDVEALPIPDRNDEKIFLTKLCTVTKARIINTNRRRRQFPQT